MIDISLLGPSGFEIPKWIKKFYGLLQGLLSLVLFLNVGSIPTDGYSIRVKVDGIVESISYLGYYYGGSQFTIDSAEVGENGSFLFQGNEPLPKGIYFVYSDNFFFEILVSEQRFSVETRSPQLVHRMITYDSKENEIYNQLQRFAFQQENRISSMTISLADVDNGNVLLAELNKIEAESRNYKKSLAEKHVGTFVEKVINAMTDPEIPDHIDGKDQLFYLKEHYFDNVDFSEPALLRTPVIVKKYDEYLDQLTTQNTDSIIESIDHIIDQVEGFTDYYRFTVSFLAQKYLESFPEAFLHVAQNHILSKGHSWMSESQLATVKENVNILTPKNRLGALAPDISLLDPDFGRFNLYSLPAKYLVLYFYDPDCSHCKIQTPILFNTYLEFRSKGLEVLAVCVTTDVKRWREFIEKDNWDWVNGADPYFNSDFRNDYKVLTTPMLYVLDSNKKILANNLDVADLPEFLKTLDF